VKYQTACYTEELQVAQHICSDRCYFIVAVVVGKNITSLFPLVALTVQNKIFYFVSAL